MMEPLQPTIDYNRFWFVRFWFVQYRNIFVQPNLNCLHTHCWRTFSPNIIIFRSDRYENYMQTREQLMWKPYLTRLPSEILVPHCAFRKRVEIATTSMLVFQYGEITTMLSVFEFVELNTRRICLHSISTYKLGIIYHIIRFSQINTNQPITWKLTKSETLSTLNVVLW